MKARADGLRSEPDVNKSLFMRPVDFDADEDAPRFECYEDDDMGDFQEPPSEESEMIEFDRYVGAKVRENVDGIDYFGVVKGPRKRSRGDDSFVGCYHENYIPPSTRSSGRMAESRNIGLIRSSSP